MRSRLLLTFSLLAASSLTSLAVFPPGSDSFAAAPTITDLNGVSGTVVNTTFTAEASEPAIRGQPPLRSAWWRWTAPADGFVIIETVPSFSDTPTVTDSLIAAYTGTILNSLTLIKSGDDYPPGQQSRMIFSVTSGQEYRIKADGFDNSDVGAITLSLRFFQPGTRSYAGTVSNASTAGRQAFVTLNLTASGAYSGKLMVPGKTFPFSGHAGAEARILLGIPTAPASAPQSLEIDLANGTRPLPLRLSNGEAVTEASLNPSALFTKQTPTPLAGNYSLVLSQTPAPGYLIGKISPTGRVTFAGKTGDGVAISLGTSLTAKIDGKFAAPFLVNTFRSQGYLFGFLDFTEAGAVDEASASLRYVRPTSTGAFLPAGVNSLAAVFGGTYVAPTNGQRVFLKGTAGAGKLEITAAAGEIGAVTENLTLSTRNTFTFASATRKPALKINVKTGLVTGSIVEPASRKRKLTGILCGGAAPFLSGSVSGITTTARFDVEP